MHCQGQRGLQTNIAIFLSRLQIGFKINVLNLVLDVQYDEDVVVSIYSRSESVMKFSEFINFGALLHGDIGIKIKIKAITLFSAFDRRYDI